MNQKPDIIFKIKDMEKFAVKDGDYRNSKGKDFCGYGLERDMSIDLEKAKPISANDLVKASEKVWDEMPLVQIMLRDRMFQELITRLALHLGLVDKVFEEES